MKLTQRRRNSLWSFPFLASLTVASSACGGDEADASDSPTSSGSATSSGGASSGGAASGGAVSGSGGASSGSGGASSGSGGQGSGVSGSGGSPEGGLAPVTCESPFADPAAYTSGLPLLQSNPGAGLVLYVDYDGGNYGGDEPLSGYYTGTAEQRANIVRSFNYLVQYFAMFDLSITTDASKIGAGSNAQSWGWIVVTPDISGGLGKYNGIGKPTYGMSKCSSSTMTNSDRSRRIAHELGHNMNLYHDGLYEGGVFCKFEDCATWDGVYGSIMGGGGEGERNGWGLALFDPDRGGSSDPGNLQDSMAKVRKVVRELGGGTSNDGWAIDDHPDGAPSPLCARTDGSLYRIGVLGSPDDVDVFSLSWQGGDLEVVWEAPEVSAALVSLEIYRDGAKVGDESVPGAAAGVYEIRVKSQGDYGAIGYYTIDVL